MIEQKSNCQISRDMSEKVAELLVNFFASTDTIRAMPRLSLVQREQGFDEIQVETDGNESAVKLPLIESAKYRFVNEICIGRQIRSSESHVIYHHVDEHAKVSTLIEQAVEFKEDPIGEIKARAITPEGFRYIQEAKFGQRTITETGKLSERSLILLLVSVAELFTNRLLRLHFREYPKTLGNCSITIDDLRNYDCIDDAVDHAIDSVVESILRKSALEWLDDVVEKMNIENSPIQDLLADFDETFARRNALIHSGGEVGRQYLSRCSKYANDNNIERGTILGAEPGYINSRIDSFVSVLGYIGYAVLLKLDKKERDRRSRIFNDQVLKELDCGRYSLAARLSKIVENDPLVEESTKLTAAINYSQALKWAGNSDAVLKHLANYDWSTRENKFKLAKAVLTDDFEAARELARKCLDSGDLQIDSLVSWPLFRECRKQSIFDDVINTYGNDSAYSSIDAENRSRLDNV